MTWMGVLSSLTATSRSCGQWIAACFVVPYRHVLWLSRQVIIEMSCSTTGIRYSVLQLLTVAKSRVNQRPLEDKASF